MRTKRKTFNIVYTTTCFSLFFVTAQLFLSIINVPIFANAVTQAYKTTTVIPNGSIVSVTKNGSDEVEKTTTYNERLLIGVVVDGQDSLIDIQPQGPDVRVAVSGEATVLVSNQNGDIEAGDLLIASPLAGIATKDLPSSSSAKYIGVATEKFNYDSQSKEIEAKDEDGSIKKIRVGYVNTKLLLNDRTDSSKDKNFLTVLAEKIVRRSVDTIQALIAAFVAALGLIIVGTLLNSSIKGTFRSIGRNPMAKDSLLSGLVRVAFLAAIVLVVTIAASYIILLV